MAELGVPSPIVRRYRCLLDGDSGRRLQRGGRHDGRSVGEGAQGAVVGQSGIMVLVERDKKERAEEVKGEDGANP